MTHNGVRTGDKVLTVEQKSQILIAAGLGCGTGCQCVAKLAESMDDKQVGLVGTMMVTKDIRQAFQGALGIGDASGINEGLIILGFADDGLDSFGLNSLEDLMVFGPTGELDQSSRRRQHDSVDA